MFFFNVTINLLKVVIELKIFLDPFGKVCDTDLSTLRYFELGFKISLRYSVVIHGPKFGRS